MPPGKKPTLKNVAKGVAAAGRLGKSGKDKDNKKDKKKKSKRALDDDDDEEKEEEWVVDTTLEETLENEVREV